MREDSIVVACDAGIPVVLAATRRAAGRLERLAEDLLVAGAELEIISGIERAPARLAEAIDRFDRPAVIALCHTEDDLELDAVRELLAMHDDVGHVRVECELGTGAAGASLQPVLIAMRELLRRTSETALPVVADPTPQRGEHVSDAILVPPMLPALTAAVQRPRRRRRAWALALGMTATASLALAMTTMRPAAHASEVSHDDAFAEPTIKPPTSPDPPRTQPPLPRIQVAAQGPTPVVAAAPLPRDPIVPVPVPVPDPTPTESTPPPESELDIAIRRQLALVDGDLVAHVVSGDRDWFGAMNTCRSRGFWRTQGWRVPTVAELRSLARTRAFADAVFWSSRRGAIDPETAVAVEMRGGATTTTDKQSTDVSTICVKARG